jgi:hypothetical protein
VDDCDFVFSNAAAQSNRGAWVALEARTAIDDIEAFFPRPARERLTGSSRNHRTVTTMCELAREPERLSLTASPSALGIDMQHSIGHGAQLPRGARHTQASRLTPRSVVAQ